jgi:hypothetical protein
VIPAEACRNQRVKCADRKWARCRIRAESRGSRVRFCPIFFRHEKRVGDTPLMLPAPTARRVPTETGFKLRVGSELTTIERLPVCNLGDHFWSEWGSASPSLAAADSVQTKIPRHGPMIRRVRLSDGRLRRRQALRKYVVKGGIRKTMSARVSNTKGQ